MQNRKFAYRTIRESFYVIALVWYHVLVFWNEWLVRYELRHEISNNVVCATSDVVFATSKASYQPAHTRSLIRTFASRLNIL